jgi:arylesterase/paraoxonase
MKKIIIVIIIGFCLVAAFAVKTMIDAGQFKTISSHGTSSSLKIPGLPGPEDITVDADNGFAFISSDDRTAALAGHPAQGAIFGLDLNANDTMPVSLTNDFNKEFHPHGISLYKGNRSETLLFVINHANDGASVEIFEYRDKKLIHSESISNPLLFSPNDIVAVGPRSFYATNDHGASSPFDRTIEEYLQLKSSYVVYFDGNRMDIAARGFGYANGINVSRDGKRLFVAATTGRTLHVFARDISTGKLVKALDIPLKTALDNIELDTAGNLFIACHPKIFDFMAHAKDTTKLSPSQVLKITFTDSNRYDIQEVYLNDGKEISASSVAAPYKDSFLIGQVFNGFVLRCE